MNPNFFVILLALLVITLYIVIVSIAYPKSKSEEVTLGLSETRVYTASSTWYQEVSVGNVQVQNYTDAEGDVQLMSFAKTPLLTARDFWILSDPNVPLEAAEYSWNFNYWWSWYLHPGSQVVFSWNYTIPINIYFIRSTKGFDRYYDDEDIGTYLMRQTYARSGTYTASINSGDIYFAIVENWEGLVTARGGVNFAINATLYDVSNPKSSCTAPCGLNVPFSSDDVFLLYTPTVSSQIAQGKGSANSEFTFDFHKSSRAWFVGVVLYLIPILGVILIVGIILFYCNYDPNGNVPTSPSSSMTISSGSPSSPIPMENMGAYPQGVVAYPDPNAQVMYPAPVYGGPAPYPAPTPGYPDPNAPGVYGGPAPYPAPTPAYHDPNAPAPYPPAPTPGYPDPNAPAPYPAQPHSPPLAHAPAPYPAHGAPPMYHDQGPPPMYPDPSGPPVMPAAGPAPPSVVHAAGPAPPSAYPPSTAYTPNPYPQTPSAPPP